MSQRFMMLMVAVCASWFLIAIPSHADEPITQRANWSGKIGYFATGEPTAIDTNADNRVDTDAQPASFDVLAPDIPVTATLVQAFLYWGGSITQPTTGCVGESLDDTVTFTPPGEPASVISGDACYCADAGAASYDIQLCRTDVTPLIPLSMVLMAAANRPAKISPTNPTPGNCVDTK